MSILHECSVDCPYCGEPITLLVDPSCSDQSYTEDCEVCCQPMVVNALVDDDGQISISVAREDE